MTMFTVLLVAEKEIEGIRSAVEEKNGLKILKATTESAALQLMDENNAQIVLVDENVLHRDGGRFFRLLKNKNCRARIGVTTTEPSIKMAVQTVKWGAEDYFVLPKDHDSLQEMMKETYEAWNKRKSNDHRKKWTFDSILGKSEEMKQVIEMGRKVSESDVSHILIRGETGTGKGLIARAIHYSSPKADQPFVEINMTAIPETLLEAELFGYEKGAFTDAKHQKRGMFEMADGGTLFLDEIGHMSLGLQMKLLNVVEENVFRRLGGTKDIEVNLRIIAATNANLEEAIQKETLRKDLYFRLNTVSIFLPPIRDRGEDVILLARYFLETLNQGEGSRLHEISSQVERSLLQYSWPGNVRELKNGVERAALLGNENLILPQGIPSTVGTELGSTKQEDFSSNPSEKDTDESDSDSHLSLKIPIVGITFEEMERQLIEEILHLTRWNKSEASRLLKISRPRLLRKIDKYHISRSIPAV